jgi:hypothetical protein
MIYTVCDVLFSYFMMFVKGLRHGDCRRLRVGSFVSLMRVVDNRLGADGGAAVGQWLTALTALQTLDLRGNDVYCCVVFLTCFDVREGIATRGL